MESKDIRKRKEEYKNIIFKNPNMIPVIVKYSNLGSENTEHKILVPKAFSSQDFIFGLRKKLKVGEKNALFIQVGEKVLPTLDKPLLAIYKEYKDADGFLYVQVSAENHFGSE